MKTLIPILFLSTACASAPLWPHPQPNMREVPIQGPDVWNPNADWQIGALKLQILRQDSVDLLGGGRCTTQVCHRVYGQFWRVRLVDPGARPLETTCVGHSYMELAQIPGRPDEFVARQPTALDCHPETKDNTRGEAILRLEMTNAGTNPTVGGWREDAGLVDVERAERPNSPDVVPTRYQLRLDGQIVAWLAVGNHPRLLVNRALHGADEQTVLHAAAMALLLGRQAPEEFRGMSAYPPSWARSPSPDSLLIPPTSLGDARQP